MKRLLCLGILVGALGAVAQGAAQPGPDLPVLQDPATLPAGDSTVVIEPTPETADQPSGPTTTAQDIYCNLAAYRPTFSAVDRRVIGTATASCTAPVDILSLQVCIQRRSTGTSTWGSPTCGPVSSVSRASRISRSFSVYCTRGGYYDYRTYALSTAIYNGVSYPHNAASGVLSLIPSQCP